MFDGLYWIDISSCHPSIPTAYTCNAIMNSVSWILERTNVYGTRSWFNCKYQETEDLPEEDWRVNGWFFFSAYTDLGQHIAQETLTLAEGRE